MEGLFEANKIAVVSLSKLNTCRNGHVPLRRTLLISKVLDTAQNVATSAHTSLLSESLHSTSKCCSSKLLSNFGLNPDTMDNLPVSLPRASLPGTLSRPKSPISTEPLTPCESRDTGEAEEDAMDFENMNSILSSILMDTELEDFSHSTLPLPSPTRVLDNLSNMSPVDSWLSTGTDSCWEGVVPSSNRPVSPGKRNHQQAFPFLGQDCELAFKDPCEDSKRFKPSYQVGHQLESVPGFCAYLSLKNLQTAPFITYMFGRGFSEPSNSSAVGDWPDKKELAEHTTTSLSIHSPPVTTSPILAF